MTAADGSIRFEPNPRMADAIASDPTLARSIAGRVGRIRSEIPANVPAGAFGGRRARDFARLSFARVEGAGTPELRGVVGTRWKLGHIVEFGSAKNPAYAPVRKTARAAGYRFTDGGR